MDTDRFVEIVRKAPPGTPIGPLYSLSSRLERTVRTKISGSTIARAHGIYRLLEAKRRGVEAGKIISSVDFRWPSFSTRWRPRRPFDWSRDV